jgi:hypothetical protein
MGNEDDAEELATIENSMGIDSGLEEHSFEKTSATNDELSEVMENDVKEEEANLLDVVKV